MSTAIPAERADNFALIEGDHLDQPEFHRRYEATPPGFRAELIDGVVSIPGRITADHGFAQCVAIGWLGFYAIETLEVRPSARTTVILGSQSEPEPDAVMRIKPECGGQTVVVGDYVHGAPELVIEISDTTRYIDLGPKLVDYGRAGVSEYVVLALNPNEVQWFRQTDGALARVAPAPDGFYRSNVFPGLWLDPDALLTGDLRRLRQVVELGLATPEHAAFVARLAANRASG